MKSILASGITLEELQLAKQRAIGRYQRGSQTVSGLAGGYARKYFWDDTLEQYDQYPDRIKAITRSRTQDAVQKLFSEQDWSIGFLGTLTDKEQQVLHEKSKLNLEIITIRALV